MPSLAVAKHLIRLCLGMCNLLLRCRNPPEEVEFMRNRKQKEQEQAMEEKAAQVIENQDNYPSMYLYGRGRHRKQKKK